MASVLLQERFVADHLYFSSKHLLQHSNSHVTELLVLLHCRYGSYEHPYDPSFSRDQLSLLDRGWTVAIAHIRGGGDMGRMWYEDGKYLKKINTFTDFIACAEHLIKVGMHKKLTACHAVWTPACCALHSMLRAPFEGVHVQGLGCWQASA
jgi:hypothetical protein